MMRFVLFFFLIFLLSCNKNISENIDNKININDNLSFNDFKKLIEKKGLEMNFPDINKWKKI